MAFSRVRGARLRALVLVAILVVSAGIFVPPSSPRTVAERASSGLSSRAPIAAGPSEVEQASHSLGLGEGPASGVPWTCSSGGPSASCRPATAATGGNATWSRLQVPFTTTLHPMGYGASGSGSLIFDRADGYLLFLRSGNGVSGDTWTYANGTWTQLKLSAYPPVTDGYALTYDFADHFVLLFGGAPGASCGGGCPPSGQTWAFARGIWFPLHPLRSPPPQIGAAMSWDGADGYVVLLDSYSVSNPVCYAWLFVDGSWTPDCSSGVPFPRKGAVMAYDPSDGYVVLFGGYGCSRSLCASVGPLNETWTYAGGNWTFRSSPSNLPLPSGSAFVTDAADGYPVYYPGGSHTQSWKFVGGNWSSIPQRIGHFPGYIMGYDATLGGIRLLAGSCGSPGARGNNYCQYQWVYSHGNWTNVSAGLAPNPLLLYGVMAYDWGDRAVLVLTHGIIYSRGSVPLEVWEFRSGTWTELPPGTVPPGPYVGEMVYDSADASMLLFGAGYGNETWSFANATWTNRTGGPAPPVRTGEALTYDDHDGYVLLFSGSCAYSLCADEWTYHAGAWTNRTASLTVAPLARRGAAITNDSRDGYVVLFGGNGAFTFTDTWTYSGGNWTRLSPSKSPPSFSSYYYPTLVYDVARSVALLTDSSGGIWSFAHGGWNYTKPPISRFSVGYFWAYDGADDLALALSGSLWEPELWGFGIARPHPVTVHAVGLPAGTSFNVTIDPWGGAPIGAVAATAPSAALTLPSGQYTLRVTTGARYLPEPTSVSFSLLANGTNVTIAFHSEYAVKFVETGLPKGTLWTVELGGLNRSTSGTTLVFYEPSTSYGFAIGPVPGYLATPSAATVSVKGANVTVAITFS